MFNIYVANAMKAQWPEKVLDWVLLVHFLSTRRESWQVTCHPSPSSPKSLPPQQMAMKAWTLVLLKSKTLWLVKKRHLF